MYFGSLILPSFRLLTKNGTFYEHVSTYVNFIAKNILLMDKD